MKSSHRCQNLVREEGATHSRLCGKPAAKRRLYWFLCDECAKGPRWLEHTVLTETAEEQRG